MVRGFIINNTEQDGVFWNLLCSPDTAFLRFLHGVEAGVHPCSLLYNIPSRGHTTTAAAVLPGTFKRRPAARHTCTRPALGVSVDGNKGHRHSDEATSVYISSELCQEVPATQMVSVPPSTQ